MFVHLIPAAILTFTGGAANAEDLGGHAANVSTAEGGPGVAVDAAASGGDPLDGPPAHGWHGILGDVLIDARCAVEVRLIRGAGRAANGSASTPPDIDDALRDLIPQLETLPYARYHHLQTLRQTIPVEETGVFSLLLPPRSEHVLLVVPQTVTSDAVSLMVDWKDEGGEQLVSSKLRIANGKGVVLGTELSADASAIVGVTARCR